MEHNYDARCTIGNALYSFYGLHDKEVLEHAKRVWYLAPGELITSCLRFRDSRDAAKAAELDKELDKLKWSYKDPFDFNG